MKRALRALALLLFLTGCGSGDQRPAGFVNHTELSDDQLWTIWKAAQQSLAHQIDMNPLQRSFENVPPDTRPGDPRALGIQPREILVVSAPDVSVQDLYEATGITRGNPTGLIACPEPCNVRFAAAYSSYSQEVTRYARSWESQGDSFHLILQYEFENHILYELGYDMDWR